MLDRYKTIITSGTAEIIEKKSRFISYASPITSEDDAQLFIDSIRKKNWDASHNVFAYQLGERNQIQRQSDDGEPSGTAGLPALDVLRNEDIKNVLVVVTRYFGGTLLGTGGLVRCYGKATQAALSDAGVVEKILCKSYRIKTDYHLSGKIQYALLQNNHIIHDTIYTDAVEYIVYVENLLCRSFLSQIKDISNACVQPEELESLYIT